jgi:DmsE family decaheme c-type cytochrome
MNFNFVRGLRALMVFAVAALGWMSVFAQSPTPSPAASAPRMATYMGEKACRECHSQEDSHFSDTLHAKTFRLNPKNDREKQVCEACHGPGSLHVKNTKDKSLIVSFTRSWGTPVALQNESCLNCHKGGNRLHWPNSIHQTNQLACADCHNPMEKVSPNGLLVKTTISEVCMNCHQQQRAEFNKRSHMPLPEGKMTCVDCHNPHGTVTKPLLKGDSVNAVCYSCHAEKRGPFLWEHAPVRENCSNCHVPHGSNNDKLLVSARPLLCQQCHSPSVGHPGQFYNASQTAAAATAGGTPSQRIIGRSCQNCHSQIHGSNHPAGARFQR